MAGFALMSHALCLAAAAASADPPKLTATAPLGVQRGHVTDVVFHGAGLHETPRLLAPFPFQLEDSAGTGSDAARWKVRMNVDARTAVGVYPIRVATESGVSNPILFAVGQVAQVAEVEPNSAFTGAQIVSTPVVVEGECAGNDVDFFKFKGKKGDRIVVDAVCARVGSGVDPTVRLTSASARFVASADDTPGLFTDGYLTAVLPEDGDYIVEFCDSRFAGTGRAGYRLLIGAVPYAGEAHPFALPRGENAAVELRGGTLSGPRLFALRTPADSRLAMFWPVIPARLLGDPAWSDSSLDVELPVPLLLGGPLAVVEPDDRSVKLPPLVPPVTIVGRLATEGERDSFSITAQPGSKHEIRVEAWGLGSALDGQLRVVEKGGRVLGETDDGKSSGGRRGGGGGGRAQGPVSTDPAFDLTMPSGTDGVTLVVKDLIGRGGVGYTYRVVVTPDQPGFQLALLDEQFAVPRGGVSLLKVAITRRGYEGAIAFEVVGLPADGGVTALPSVAGPRSSEAVIPFRASANATFSGGDVQIIGRGDHGPVVTASKTIVFAEQTIADSGFGIGGTIPSYTRPSVSLALAVCRPGPIEVAVEPKTYLVPQGTTVDVPLQVTRSHGDKKIYKVAAIAPPTGLNVAELELDPNRVNATAKLTAAPDMRLGDTAVGLALQTPAPAGPGRRRGGAAAKKDAASPASATGPAIWITLEVVRPAQLVLADNALTVAPGGTAPIRGRVARAFPFGGEVEIKLDGLPAGVKAGPVKVAAGATDFSVALEAAANAPVGEKEVAVLPAYKIGGKDHKGEPRPLRLKVLGKK
jgi:hypothetical protein